MSQSIADACNSALQKVGAARILALTDNSREARACNVAFDSNRRDEIRKYRWNFAKKRAVLAPDSTAPDFGYDYQFTMPSDCLRVLLPKDEYLDWKIEGRKILTNFASSPYDLGSAVSSDSTALGITYIADIEDVAFWDPSFYNVFAISLALDLVEELTQSNQKKQLLAADYKEAIKEARAANAFELLPEDAPDDTWWLARY